MEASRARSEFVLIGMALFIAFVIWLIAKQGELEIDRLEIPVQLENEGQIMNVRISPQFVRIAVQYPVDLRNSIVPSNFSLRINVREVFREDPATWKTPEQLDVEYSLSEDMVRRPSLSQRVQVIDIEPDRVTLDAELVTRRVRVVPHTVGELPPTLRLVGEIRATPPELLVTGTTDGFNALALQQNQILTEPIDLRKITQSNQIFANLVIPEGVKILQREEERVAIDIAVEEVSEQRTLNDVAINVPIAAENIAARVRPPTANVVVEGPPSALNRLTQEDILLSPQRGLEERVGNVQKVGLEARFRQSVPPDVIQRVKIIETRPTSIEVEFVTPSGEDEAGAEPELPVATESAPLRPGAGLPDGARDGQ